MSEIPLASLLNLFETLIALLCALFIWIRKRSAIFNNPLVVRFFICFTLSAVTFFIFSTPGLIVRDLLVMQLVYTFGDVCVLLTNIYLVFIPIKIYSKNSKIATVITRFIFVFAAFYLIHNLITLSPVTVVRFGPFIDWRGSTNPLLQTIDSAIAGLCLLSAAILFFNQGWKHKDITVKKRSRFFGSGFLLVLFGWISIFVFTASSGSSLTIILAGSAIGNTFISIGLVLLLVGVFTQEKSPVL